MVFSWEYLAIFSKTSKDFFFYFSFKWRQKAERRLIWASRGKGVSGLELQSNQNATDLTVSNINTRQEESSCTPWGLRPGYSPTLRTTCWAQELGSKCAQKSHGEGCGWENWLASVLLQHTATELSLHGFHCAAPPSERENVLVCKRLGTWDIAPTGNGKGREVKNQTWVEVARKHTSAVAIQCRAWAYSNLGRRTVIVCYVSRSHWLRLNMRTSQGALFPERSDLQVQLEAQKERSGPSTSPNTGVCKKRGSCRLPMEGNHRMIQTWEQHENKTNSAH